MQPHSLTFFDCTLQKKYLVTYLLRTVQNENILREKKISHAQFTYFGQTYPGIVISIYLPTRIHTHIELYILSIQPASQN